MRISYFFTPFISCAAIVTMILLNPMQSYAGDDVFPEEVMALVYLCDTYPVSEQASEDSDIVSRLPCGQTVTILGEEYSEDDGLFWVHISFYADDAERTGYVIRQNLACSDERFLEWERAYLELLYARRAEDFDEGDMENPSVNGFALQDSVIGYTDVTEYADIAQFPDSYQAALTALKQKHPKWTFVPMITGLDWEEVIAGEIDEGKSLVYYTLPDCTKEGLYDDGVWYYASEDILKYYMDPRNSLAEDTIFQFEQLTYNASYHTESSVENFLAGTFMRSPDHAPGTDMTYAHIFWTVGSDSSRKVSPFHLAARVYQEQGKGTSDLISGKYPGYENCYNYFNVSASGQTTKEVIESGLKYAKEHNWNSAYSSIAGGASVISANYIRKGQDTLYLQKYNVNPQSTHALYTHQYMQNISAPSSEAKSIKKLYASAGSLDNTFVFKIPVFENMPGTACAYPDRSTNVVLQIPAGYDNNVWVDGVVCPAVQRNGRQIVEAPNDSAGGAVVYRYDENGIPVGMYVWTLQFGNGSYTATAQPQLQDLLTYHGFSIRVTGKSGIRFKTGISESLKNTLLDTGVSGYRLKEYGTLVMNNANLQKEVNSAGYPLIRAGEKVLEGISYGTDANGQKQDLVYETMDGRQRFTSVLVGLPSEQYRTEFAFRGYLVLEKDGKEITLYGPVVARSIYALAQQVLDRGIYPTGSEADEFLSKIVQ